jgi:phosphatidylinositol glycan class C protein
MNSIKWTKKLYLKTNFPDNYVDVDSFLELKKTNVNAKFYTYWPTVYYSGIITHQISSVIIFSLVYVYLRFELVNVNDLMLFYLSPLCLVGYVSKLFIVEHDLITVKNDFMNIVKFVFFTYGLSPILNSLTETISSDTIFAMSTFMFLLNLITHNYDSSSDVAMYLFVLFLLIGFIK